MYIYKKAYKALKDNISQNCQSITFISVWNNQPNKRQSQQPIPTPAVYIEFVGFDFKNVQGKGKSQTGSGQIILHVEQEIISDVYTTKDGDSDNQDDALTRFDVMQEIHLAMQGFTLSYLKNIARVRIEPDYDHDNSIIDALIYNATLIDELDENSGQFIHIDKYNQEVTITDISVEKGERPEKQPEEGGYDITF